MPDSADFFSAFYSPLVQMETRENLQHVTIRPTTASSSNQAGGPQSSLKIQVRVRSMNQVIEPLIMTTTRREKSVEDLKEVGLDCYRLEIEAECCTVSSCGKLQVGSHP